MPQCACKALGPKIDFALDPHARRRTRHAVTRQRKLEQSNAAQMKTESSRVGRRAELLALLEDLVPGRHL